jgi:hypothetical protein
VGVRSDGYPVGQDGFTEQRGTAIATLLFLEHHQWDAMGCKAGTPTPFLLFENSFLLTSSACMCSKKSNSTRISQENEVIRCLFLFSEVATFRPFS